MDQATREKYRDIELMPFKLKQRYCKKGHPIDQHWIKCPECEKEKEDKERRKE